VGNNLEGTTSSSAPPITASQSANTNFQKIDLPAADTADSSAVLDCYITSVPDPSIGTLYQSDGTTPISSFPYPCQTTLSGGALTVYFAPAPYSLANATFNYYIQDSTGFQSTLQQAVISIQPQAFPVTLTLNTNTPVKINGKSNGLVNITMLDYNNITTANGVGDGYVVSMQNSLSDPNKTGKAHAFVGCNLCVLNLEVQCTCGSNCNTTTGDAPVSTLAAPSCYVVTYFGTKAKFQDFLGSLQSISLSGAIEGKGTLTITVSTGAYSTDLSNKWFPANPQTTTINVDYLVIEPAPGNGGKYVLPDWAIYTIYAVGPVIVILFLFFCIRWCCRCCLCCPLARTAPKKNEYGGEGEYESSAPDRL